MLIQNVYVSTLLRADLMRHKRTCQYVDSSECDGFHKLYCVYRVSIRVKYGKSLVCDSRNTLLFIK